MIIEFPNSPGVEITITRGGNDPITDERFSDQMVQISWAATETDDDGNEVEVTRRHMFLGPQ